MPRGSPSSVSQISDHRVRGLLVEDAEPGPDRAGPLDEQGHRVGGQPPSTVNGDTVTTASPGDLQVLPRGRQDAGDVGAGEDLADRRRGRREHVLAVVDHDQQRDVRPAPRRPCR